MAEESGVADVVIVPKFDMQCHESKMTRKDVKNLSLTEKVIDLHPVPSELLFGAGLATTWEFLGFFLVFKDTGGNVVTMKNYYSSPPPLSVDQPIPDKTDSQREVEVEDPKVVTAREKKKAQVARAAAKRKESKKRGNDEGGSSRVKKRKGPEVISLHSGDDDGTPRAPNDERRSLSYSPHGWINKFVHHFANVKVNQGVKENKGAEGSPPCIEAFVNMSRIPIHPAKEWVFFSKKNADESSHPEQHFSTDAPASRPRQILTSRNIEEGESSRGAYVYIPQWAIPLRCRVDTPEWCRVLMVHLAPPAAQEESNALTNDVALQRAWLDMVLELWKFMAMVVVCGGSMVVKWW
ncbi:hypothetical protein Tco_0155325 [Tanacetum coccineum]